MASMSEEQMLGNLLPFHRRIVEELIEEDGLCILSAGMGWQKVVAVLLRLQMERLKDSAESGVVLILGSTDWQRQMIYKELIRIDPHLSEEASEEAGPSAIVEATRLQLPEEVTNETPAQSRIDLYQNRACLFVTTRILVVDILNKRILGKQIAGIILMNAHRVTDSSQDGFAVRLFRESNREGFVRAFSDQPTSFIAGFGKVEKVMKALFIRKLHLWPRFESNAKTALDAVDKDIQVVELEVFMTPAMEEIYQAISELMDACIKEMRKSNKIDTTELTVENGIFKSFDDIIRRQLDSIWHTVSPRTKQIVNDLKTLRSLAEQLLSFDAVTFLAHLDNLRITEGVASIWLFHDAAHTIFEQAKRRVYHVQLCGERRKAEKGDKKGKRAKPEEDGAANSEEGIGPTVRPILEPLPKWSLVHEIMEAAQSRDEATPRPGELQEFPKIESALQDIQTEREKMSREASTSGRDELLAPVLIVTNEMRSCLQLRAVLQGKGSREMMHRLYSEYLLRRLDSKKENNKQKGARGGRSGGRGGRGGRQSAMRLEQLRAQRLQGDSVEQEALMTIAQNLAEQERTAAGNQGNKAKHKKGNKKAKVAESPPKEAPLKEDEEAMMDGDGETSPLLQNVHFLAVDGKDMGVLWEVQPVFVIVYNPDISFVRQLEVYKAEKPGTPVHVYNLWYSRSLELDRYTAELQREQKVFEDLIQQKAYIVLPDINQDLGALVTREPRERPSSMHPDVVLGLTGGDKNPNAISRKGGSRLTPRVIPKRVVIDVREFMSSLPSILYQQGLELVPLTLEVGDYVLSPEMCIERKSLSDLRSSFTSGRLYHQAESMSRHYKIPILLVEFERDKAFVLHSPQDISADIQVNSLISKLTLLTLHFPRLRLIWSRSLHATADLFRALKSNQDEPDPVFAASIGIPTVIEGGGGGGEALVNTTAIDILRRLPGVTEANYRSLITAADSLAGLAAMSEQDLSRVMGGAIAARKLKDWMDATCPRL